jgi:hypothetical protein
MNMLLVLGNVLPEEEGVYGVRSIVNHEFLINCYVEHGTLTEEEGSVWLTSSIS